MLQAVAVGDTAIDTPTGSTSAVYFLVFFGVPWNPGMKMEATVILYVDGAPIVSGRSQIITEGIRDIIILCPVFP